MAILAYLSGRARPPAAPAEPAVRGAVERARLLLARAAAAARTVPDSVVDPILEAEQCLATGTLTVAQEKAFYAAYTDLAARTADLSKRPPGRTEYPFEDAVEDSELLLKHAAEEGTQVPADVAGAILAARTALKENRLDDPVRARFYDAYAALSSLFGHVTAETIRNCSSPDTRRRLRRDRLTALVLTFLVAATSVITFVADSMSKNIAADVSTANELAAQLRVAITPPDGSGGWRPDYVSDPCDHETDPPADPRIAVRGLTEVTQLQDFAAAIRGSRDRTLKLSNMMAWVGWGECDPYDPTGKCAPASATVFTLLPKKPTVEQRAAVEAFLDARLQINPAVVNYTTEVLCKVETYQHIRTFASDVEADYAALLGGVVSFALPIFYALLGAYAYRLRLFADTIRKRTYHPSFSDSARMITAVIAGAICGLFNPARNLTLSPLAVAFLVGYGVELFFKFLDTMVNAFGTPPPKPN